MNNPSAASSVSDVEAVIALADQPILRNLKITQCYHDLSQAIATLLGTENVNWCTFATWASKTAGRFIRTEEISEEMRKALGESSGYRRWWIESINKKLSSLQSEDDGAPHSSIFGCIESVIGDTSSDIAAGNLKVFSELGPLFAALVETFAGDTSYDQGKLDRFLGRLKPGATGSDGQDLLRSAATHFYQAMFESDPHRKAERMLFANAQTGLHEQMRLQPYIAGSINAPVAEAVRELHAELAHRLKGLPGLLHKAFDLFLRPVIVRWVENQWEEMSTRFLMELKLPDGTLRLGVDLPALPGQPLFPPALQRVEDEGLRALLERYGAADETARGSGAVNWVNLSERMGFILELFRSRQQDKRLFEQPFTAAQREGIAEGRVPDGEL